MTLPSGDVISQTITLESNNEPINDDDTDPNTNTTVDFGFFPQIDLAINKALNVPLSNVIAGGNVVFDLTVDNLGVNDATSVELVDVSIRSDLHRKPECIRCIHCERGWFNHHS